MRTVVLLCRSSNCRSAVELQSNRSCEQATGVCFRTARNDAAVGCARRHGAVRVQFHVFCSRCAVVVDAVVAGGGERGGSGGRRRPTDRRHRRPEHRRPGRHLLRRLRTISQGGGARTLRPRDDQREPVGRTEVAHCDTRIATEKLSTCVNSLGPV